MFDPLTGILVPLFNPRTQVWTAHFTWDGATICPLTPEGRVTVKILRVNDVDRVIEDSNEHELEQVVDKQAKKAVEVATNEPGGICFDCVLTVNCRL